MIAGLLLGKIRGTVVVFFFSYKDHFGRSWGPFASISAVLEPPEASPGGLLSRLGASWGASGPPNLNFGRFWTSLERSWSHFGRPGPRFGRSDYHFRALGAPFGRLRHDFTPPSL